MYQLMTIFLVVDITVCFEPNKTVNFSVELNFMHYQKAELGKSDLIHKYHIYVDNCYFINTNTSSEMIQAITKSRQIFSDYLHKIHIPEQEHKEVGIYYHTFSEPMEYDQAIALLSMLSLTIIDKLFILTNRFLSYPYGKYCFEDYMDRHNCLKQCGNYTGFNDYQGREIRSKRDFFCNYEKCLSEFIGRHLKKRLFHQLFSRKLQNGRPALFWWNASKKPSQFSFLVNL